MRFKTYINNARTKLFLPFDEDLNDHNNSGTLQSVVNNGIVISGKKAQFNGNSRLTISSLDFENTDIQTIIRFTTSNQSPPYFIFMSINNFVDFDLIVSSDNQFRFFNNIATGIAPMPNTTYKLIINQGRRTTEGYLLDQNDNILYRHFPLQSTLYRFNGLYVGNSAGMDRGFFGTIDYLMMSGTGFGASASAVNEQKAMRNFNENRFTRSLL